MLHSPVAESELPLRREIVNAPVLAVPALPRMSEDELHGYIAPHLGQLQPYRIFILGVRGYYAELGQPGVDDRGIYDDAIFLVSERGIVGFNGNTNPSKVRKGKGAGAKKGMATLTPGLWQVHRFDYHVTSTKKYWAICQRAGEVKVLRDGEDGQYEDVGFLGVNIHRGGYTTTGSEGCQTIHPDQWKSFIELAEVWAKSFYDKFWQRRVVPYLLVEHS